MNNEKRQYCFIKFANLDVVKDFSRSPRVGSDRECMFAVESTRGLLGSPMTTWIGGYRGSSIIRMKNDSEVST